MIYNLLYKSGVHHILRRITKPETLTILSLHRVSPGKNYFWQPLSPEVFDALCAYLHRKYLIIRFDQIAACRHEKKPLLILSFDDGYYDFIEYAMPVLKKYNLPANHNLVYDCVSHNTTIWTQRLNILFHEWHASGRTDAGISLHGKRHGPGDFGNNWMRFYHFIYRSMLGLKKKERESILLELENKYGIDTGERMMNWRDVATLTADQIEIGNHTYSHDVISTLTEPGELDQEIVLSGKLLQERTGLPVDIFSFPNGQTRPGLMPYLQAGGYKYILEVNEKINHPKKAGNGQTVFNRITVGNEPLAKTIFRIEMLQTMLKKIRP